MDQIWEGVKVVLLCIVALYVVGLILVVVRFILLGIAWAIFWLLDAARLREERYAKARMQGENSALRDLVMKVGAGDEFCARSAARTAVQFLTFDLKPELPTEERELLVTKTVEQVAAAFVVAREKAMTEVCRAKGVGSEPPKVLP